MKTYIILQLILNATTGQPLDISRYPHEPFPTYPACGAYVTSMAPEVPDTDGHVKVYTCATEKEVTTL